MSDFKNYLVPPVIQALGPEKVREFQEFCEQTKDEFRDKTDEIFWTHVGAKFRVHINPESVAFANSGVQDVGKMAIEELKNQIDAALEGSARMISGSKAVKDFRFAPHMGRALASLTDPKVNALVKSFFELKRELVSTLFELHKKQAHADGYVLPVDLLEASGLGPCRGCLKEKARPNNSFKPKPLRGSA
jgi:hypothetical protein